MAERTHYEPGSFCWAGLATSDPLAAEPFYVQLFGWEAEASPAGYVSFLSGRQREARAAGAPPHWNSFISVEDADATAVRAGQLGGAAVFRESFDVAGAGRIAAIRDPTGAVVSLWQPAGLAGAGVVDDIGAVCWNELDTHDVDRARAFYGELLGWTYETDAGGYATIKNAGRVNGGIRRQSTRERRVPPHWVPWITVEDVDATARRAALNGGSRRAATRPARSGRAAELADPQGAAFVVFEGETGGSAAA